MHEPLSADIISDLQDGTQSGTGSIEYWLYRVGTP